MQTKNAHNQIKQQDSLTRHKPVRTRKYQYNNNTLPPSRRLWHSQSREFKIAGTYCRNGRGRGRGVLGLSTQLTRQVPRIISNTVLAKEARALVCKRARRERGNKLATVPRSADDVGQCSSTRLTRVEESVTATHRGSSGMEIEQLDIKSWPVCQII